MSTKLNKYNLPSFKESCSFVAILLILANPISASAKTTALSYQLLSATSTDKDIRHTTLYITSTPVDELAESESAENLEKAQRIDSYFEQRNMPLAGYGMEFVQAANKYNIDWRLAAAIGVRESSGGKHMMNNNPFGWGSAKIKFDDFSEAIDVVSSNLGGFNPNTARYYKNADTMKKLWYYNGTVMKKYPAQVVDIMETV